MKKNIKNKQSGITLITLAVAISILIVLSSMLVYNAKNGIKLRNLRKMQNDIEILNDKIAAYYIKEGSLPANYEYTEEVGFEPEPNDSQRYYLIDLDELEGLTLNYGGDYLEARSLLALGNSTIKDYDDVYIIDGESHHIYYLRGIIVDGETYYTNDTDDKIELKN